MDLEIIYAIVLHLASIIGFVFWDKAKDSYYKYFPIYLLIILILDCYTRRSYYKFLGINPGEVYIYQYGYFNYFVIPLEFFFFLWFYYKKLEKFRKIIQIGFFTYGIFWIIESIYRYGTAYINFFTFSYQIGALWMMLLALLYFKNLLSSDGIVDFYKERFFYVSLGIIIFYVLSMPFHVFEKIFKASNDPFMQSLYDNFSYPLNIIMYLLFAASFIWGTRN